MNYAIDSVDVDLALRLVRNAPITSAQVGFRLVLPVESVLCLPGAPEHRLYPFGLAVAAVNAANRGDLARGAEACDQAILVIQHLGSDSDNRVEQLVSVARGARASAIGAWVEAATHLEHAGKLAHDHIHVGYELGTFNRANAAIAYTMAGDLVAAESLAEEGLELARRANAPMSIAANLVALAGALADRDPKRARVLMDESLAIHANLNFDNPYDTTQSTLIAARLSDWPRVLELGADAIRNLHWSGDRSFLSGILNVVARSLVGSDPDSAAILQGAARRLIPFEVFSQSAQYSMRTSTLSVNTPVSTMASFLTDLRRAATAALRASLGDTRLRDLRAQGEAMDYDLIVTFALDVIGKAHSDSAPSC